MKKYTIAPFNSGVIKNRDPFLIPEDAFTKLRNMMVFRGRLRKRYGSSPLNSTLSTKLEKTLSSSLRIKVGTTDGAGELENVDLRALIDLGEIPLGSYFSIGNRLYMVDKLSANQGDNIETIHPLTSDTPNPLPPPLEKPIIFKVDTGKQGDNAWVPIIFKIEDIDFPNEDVFFYPSLPVMGLVTLEGTETSDDTLIAFDTKFAYRYDYDSFKYMESHDPNNNTKRYTGSDANFFSSASYLSEDNQQSLFVVNDNKNDGINILRHNKQNSTFIWSNNRKLVTKYDGGGNHDVIFSAKIVYYFKKRMLLFSTSEGKLNDINNAKTYYNRVRFSWAEDPRNNSAFYNDSAHGGFTDVSSAEKIIGVTSVRDRLIVFLEKSTYELVYTGNKSQPFIWRQLDKELGCESTNSVVNLSGSAVGVGTSGINETDGARVQRIDSDIPREVFEISNVGSAMDRVAGIRDYYNELIYWSYPSKDTKKFPDTLLVYNYKNRTWCKFDESATVLGHAQMKQSLAWKNITWPWSAWRDSWNTGTYQSLKQEVVAGNQTGHVFILSYNYGENAYSNHITNITYIHPDNFTTLDVFNHNLKKGDYIRIHDVLSDNEEDDLTALNDNNWEVTDVIDENSFKINAVIDNGDYAGSGFIERVYNINIATKELNFFMDEAYKTHIPMIEFYVARTDVGSLTVDVFSSSSSANSLIEDGRASGALLGSSVLDTFPYDDVYPFERYQRNLWHPVYTQAEGSVISLNMYFTPEQMLNYPLITSRVTINAITFSVEQGAPL